MRKALLLWVLGVVLASSLGGCGHSLFSNTDPYNRLRLRRYWDGDSAQETTAMRKRAAEFGFGFNGGAGSQ